MNPSHPQDGAGRERTGAVAGFEVFPVACVQFEFEDGVHGKHHARDWLKCLRMYLLVNSHLLYFTIYNI